MRHGEKLRALAPYAAILVLGALAYANSFAGQFMLDDDRSIGDVVDAIASLRTPWKIFAAPVFVTRPVVGFTLALSYALGGLHVWAYHLVNVAIHILAAFILYALVRRTLLSPRLSGRYATSATALATLIVLVWLLHPLQTQAVTYIIQRSEALAGLFTLLTVYAVARAPDAKKAWIWYGLATVSCLLGMGTKQTAVVIPPMVLLYDRTFLSGSFGAACKKRWHLYLALASTWLVVIILLRRAPTTLGAGFGATRITAWQYARTQPQVILHYLRLAVWPYPQCLDDMWQVATRLRDILPGACVVGAALLATLAWLRSRPTWGFLGAVFFLALAPSSSFVPIDDLAFEHRMYLPLAPIAAAIVLAAHAGIVRLQWRRFGLVLASIALLALGLRTVWRNRDYASQTVMWGDVVNRRPWNFRAHNNYGLGLRVAGQLTKAEAHFREAVRLCPTCWYALYNLGVSVELRGAVGDAIGYYRRTLASSEYPQAHGKLANALNVLGLDLRKAGQLNDAELRFREAISHDAQFWPAHYNLGLVQSTRGQYDSALASFQVTLRLNPHYDDARKQAAWAEHAWGQDLAKKGQASEATAHFRSALTFWPDYPEASASLARETARLAAASKD